jgi:hypothetical protein
MTFISYLPSFRRVRECALVDRYIDAINKMHAENDALRREAWVANLPMRVVAMEWPS